MARIGGLRAWQVATATVVLVVVAGCGLGSKSNNDAAGSTPVAIDQTSAPADDATTEPAADPTTPPTTRPTPKKTTSRPTKKPTVKATATEDPFWEQLPACAHYDKTKQVAKSKVKAALKTASAKTYWTHEAPQLKLNYPLVKAEAYMESGWQSNIHNCDGGQGIMQVMPDTVSMINGRFGLTYDASDYQQNALVGANYLAWLTKYAGDKYFKGSYDLSSSKCKSSTSWCLLNAVISGYNAGAGAVDASSQTKELANPQYVSTVRALMTRCKCDQY